MSDGVGDKPEIKVNKLTNGAFKEGTAWWLFKKLPPEYEKRILSKSTAAPKSP